MANFCFIIYWLWLDDLFKMELKKQRFMGYQVVDLSLLFKKKKKVQIMDNERITVLGFTKSVTMNELSATKWPHKKA